MARPRWVLHVQAQCWRFLMGIGMLLHRLAPPRPPSPSFSRTVKATVSTTPGEFTLWFYTPHKYEAQRRLGGLKGKGKDKGKDQDGRSKGYPCIINFHGGGFTLGSPTDDARWCGTVVEECNAVAVSVDYRLAPECPFPTAVEDGVDAILYLADHAEELGIDPDKIAISGFSSGANMSFSVPLRLYDHMTEFSRTLTHEPVGGDDAASLSVRTDGNDSRPASSNGLLRPGLGIRLDAAASSLSVNRILRSRSANVVPQAQAEYISAKTVANASQKEIPMVDLAAIVPWYPSCDYTQTREQRRATCVRKDQELPAIFTNLFDESYLHPPDTIPLDSPYLSPGIAPTALLREALPKEIILHTCEWDMLLNEGEKFRDRLRTPEINKNVVYRMIEGVPHGWDKAPNPLKPTPGVKEHYLHACSELNRVFRERDGIDTPDSEEGTNRRLSTFMQRAKSIREFGKRTRDERAEVPAGDRMRDDPPARPGSTV